jgi:hypothetical protein
VLINNIDIATFKAILTVKDIQTADVVTYDDWLRNALNPLYSGKTEQFKKINIQFAISDTTDDGALTNISNIVQQLEKSTIKFDDVSFYYDCTIANKSNEKITNGFYLLNVELKSGYAYKPAVIETMNGITSKTITVPGNLPTPAVVTLTPTIDTISAALTGLSKNPIIINNLHANTPITINGEKCTVTEADIDTTLNVATGAGKWNFRKYNMSAFANPDDTDIHIAPVYATIPAGSPYSQKLVPDGNTLAYNLGYDYLGYLKTAVNVTTSQAMSFYFYHDDGASVYCNGSLVYSHDYHCDNNNGAASATMTLNAGWNVIEILWIQHYGADGIWGVTPVIGSQVVSLNCYYSKGTGSGIVNKFSDADLWAFPVLQPGLNTVGIDHSTVPVQILYKPKFI